MTDRVRSTSGGRPPADLLDSTVRIRFEEAAVNQCEAISRAPPSKVVDMKHQHRHRSHSISQNVDLRDALTTPGREPGINLNTLGSSLESVLYQECEIVVVDYCKERYCMHGPFDNDSFLSFLDEPRPEWSKLRWINVNGMSFDIMRKLANVYQITELAIEDAVHFPTRTKIDHYSEHSYVCLALLLLSEEEDSDTEPHNKPSLYQKLRQWVATETVDEFTTLGTEPYLSSDFQTSKSSSPPTY